MYAKNSSIHVAVSIHQRVTDGHTDIISGTTKHKVFLSEGTVFILYSCGPYYVFTSPQEGYVMS